MRYDVVVIGAGSAGNVVATRLSEDPGRRVLLLEAGPDWPTFDRIPPILQRGGFGRGLDEYLWGYSARATDRQGPTPLPRGRLLGGTGAINGQLHVWGQPEDFARWVERGCTLWGFDAVAPVYRAIEHDLDFSEGHGTSGPIQARRPPRSAWLPLQEAFYVVCRAAGFPDSPDTNRPGTTGIGPFVLGTVDDRRAGTAQRYLEPVRDRANLEVRGRATVRRLVLSGSRVSAVEVVTPDGEEMIGADRFVLSAGAIGTPLLLQRSGVGDPAALRAAGIPVALEIPGVGLRLRDHQVIDLIWNAAPGYPLPPANAPLTQLALRYTAVGSSHLNDMKLTARGITKALPDGSAPPGPVQIALVPDLELPFGSGEVRATAAALDAPPEISLRFVTDPEDRRRLREAVRLSLDLAAREPLAGLLGERVTPLEGDLASDAALDEWLWRAARTSHHLCGGCAMGPDGDALAVADQRGRVRGLDNLRIADASLFPDIVRGNINLTTIMVAERVAAFMREEGRS